MFPGFSKGWKEAFMSGDQEPWVFRGGLIADLQRLMPIDQGNDLFVYKLPDLPTTDYHMMRPYNSMDEAAINTVCTQGFLSLVTPPAAEEKAMPLHLNAKFADLIADSIVGPFVTLHPEFCIVATDSQHKVVGYAAAALDFNAFSRNALMCWIPEMREKYPESLEELEVFDIDTPHSQRTGLILRSMIKEFHSYEPQCPPEVISSYPAVMTSAVLDQCLNPDYGVAKRLITVLLATLRSNGCFGVHIRLPAKDVGHELLQYYAKLGFTEIYRDGASFLYFGRRF